MLEGHMACERPARLWKELRPELGNQEVCLSHSDRDQIWLQTGWKEKGGEDLGLGTCHNDPAKNPRGQKCRGESRAWKDLGLADSSLTDPSREKHILAPPLPFPVGSFSSQRRAEDRLMQYCSAADIFPP